MLKQIGLNSLWLFLSRVFAQFLHLVFIGIIARNLGVNAFGSYALYALILFIGNIFTTYGTDALLIREITRERKISASFSASAWVQILLSILWLISLFLISIFLNFDLTSQLSLLIINLCLFPQSFKSVFSSVFRAFERMDIQFALGFLGISIQTLLAFIFIKDLGDLLLLCVLLFLNQLFLTFISYIIYKKIIPEFVSIEKPVIAEIVKILRAGWKLALYFPLSSFYQSLNLFVLSFLLGPAVTGIFSASTRIVEGIKIGHFSLSNGMMPTMAKSMTQEINATLRKSFLLLLGWSFFADIGLLIFAKPLINILYGASYLDSTPALRIIGFVLVPYTVSVYFSLKLIMTQHEKLVLNVLLVCLPIGIFLYFYLISNFGLLGAAWGTLINEIIFASLLLIGSRAIK